MVATGNQNKCPPENQTSLSRNKNQLMQGKLRSIMLERHEMHHIQKITSLFIIGAKNQDSYILKFNWSYWNAN